MDAPGFVAGGAFPCTQTRARAVCRRRVVRCAVSPPSASEGVVRFEGSLPDDVVDEELERALSAGWGELELFGEQEKLHGKGENGGKGRGKAKIVLGGDEADEEPKVGQEGRSGDVDDSALDSAAGKDAGMPEPITVTSRESGVASTISHVEKASDDAVAAINEAKAPKKAKRKRAKKGTVKGSVGSGAKEGDSNEGTEKTMKDDKQKQMSQAELRDAEEWDKEPRWFFLQVKPGCEQSCAISIRNMAIALPHLNIKDVLVPSTNIMRLTKGGKSVSKEERIFPGYMLVCMVMDKQSYADVQRVPNVQFFMGDPNRDKKKDQPFRQPLPVSNAEMRVVFDKVREADRAKPEHKTSLRPGDSVAIVGGTYKGSKGKVLEVKPDLNVVKTSLIIFGRKSAVDLKFSEVDLLQDEEQEEQELSPGEEVDGDADLKSKAGVASDADDDDALLSLEDGDDEGQVAPQGDASGFEEALLTADDELESDADGFHEGEVTLAEEEGKTDRAGAVASSASTAVSTELSEAGESPDPIVE